MENKSRIGNIDVQLKRFQFENEFNILHLTLIDINRTLN